ncbi:MAG: GNAT family N-acetyltransferase [Actinomycetes bacterium]
MVDRVLTKDFALRGQWDAYGILSEPFAHENGIEILQGDEEINRFLSEHAPDSSVFAPNPEVKFWGAVRTTEGDLAAIGAMTRWESGEHIISSVATDAQLRGQGYGAALMKGLLGLANRDGIERVGLAVYAKNEAAKRLYEKVGFTCMGRFNYFEPVH